ncbi:hypothetical protein [Streptomyces abikoensis]
MSSSPTKATWDCRSPCTPPRWTHRIVDYDVDPHRIKRLTAGDSYVEDVIEWPPPKTGYQSSVRQSSEHRA